MPKVNKTLSNEKNPTKGLSEETFLLISQLTPMVNVELLIQDKNKGTLLTWRHDKFYGPAWHLPGGIIRFKELEELEAKERKGKPHRKGELI